MPNKTACTMVYKSNIPGEYSTSTPSIMAASVKEAPIFFKFDVKSVFSHLERNKTMRCFGKEMMGEKLSSIYENKDILIVKVKCGGSKIAIDTPFGVLVEFGQVCSQVAIFSMVL